MWLRRLASTTEAHQSLCYIRVRSPTFMNDQSAFTKRTAAIKRRIYPRFNFPDIVSHVPKCHSVPLEKLGGFALRLEMARSQAIGTR
jgi:hypothetical protein